MAIDMKLFEEGLDRRNTDCSKWDDLGWWKGKEIIPLSIADMDFATPAAVSEAIIRRAQHGAFGYCKYNPEDYEAVVRWMKNRHGVEIDKDAVMFSPGVVDSSMVATAALGKPGDKVVILTPVYPSFFGAANTRGLQEVRCPLLHEDGKWSMDYEAIEDAFRAGAKLFLLCNPHNPVGRVWTEEELRTLVSLTRRYGVTIISDDIHADLIMPEHEQTSILKVEPHSIAMISGTKTFNLAGIRQSSVLIPDPDLRKVFMDEYHDRKIDGVNMFGRIAQTVAYNEGGEWLDALIQYLAGTRDMVEEFFRTEIPQVSVSRMEGTYLMWLDCRAFGKTQEELGIWSREKAGVGFTEGTAFGVEGTGFLRMNIATPRKNIVQALEQVKNAINCL